MPVVKSNISKLYIANFLTGLVFWYSIEKLFMKQIGISSFGVGVNAAVFLAITLLFDIPAGVLADKWKRKYVLVLAMICLGLGSIIAGASHSLTPYIVGSCFFGLYVVLSSGTYQALMYDSLREVGQEAHYDRYQGRAYGLFLLGIAISSLAGGYVAHAWGYPIAYFLSAIPVVFNMLLLFSIVEPTFHKRSVARKVASHIGDSFRALKVSPLVLHLAFFVVVGGILRNSQNEFAGLYYIALGFTAIPTGYANAMKWFSGSLGQYYAEKVGRNILRFMPIMFIAFLGFTLIHSPIGLAFFYLAVFLHATTQNQAEAEIQNHITSSLRATTLSVLTFSTNVILVPLGLLFGWVAQNYSVYRSYQVVAAIGGVYLVSWLLFGRKAIRLAYSSKPSAIEVPIEAHEVIK